MSSMIHLAVGRLEIDWGQNWSFSDHSALFQADADVKDIPYYYLEDKPDFLGQYRPIIELKKGLSKPLVQVIDRINLLGHTFSQCEQEFKYLAAQNQFDSTRFTFSQLRDALATIDVNAISPDHGEGGEDFGKFFRRQLAPRLGLMPHFDAAPRGLLFDASEGMENLSAYTVLHLMALNPQARDLPVQWSFLDIEEGGYARQEDFVRPLDPMNRFLIVTEGSSDAAILRKGFEILRPHIADFFKFVDMEEGYPFSGTGSVYRFVQGLISISVQNNVLVLFDNDTDGVWNYNRARELKVLPNMRILKLPDISFQTIPNYWSERRI